MEVYVYYSCDSCNLRADCANSGIGGCRNHKLFVDKDSQLEEWHSILGTVKMPAGTFDEIYNTPISFSIFSDDDLEI